MATLEEIMLELKSQEGDDKKEGFSNALLGQVTPTTPSEAGNKLLSPFGLSLGEQQPQPFGPVNQQAQPISILGQAPATPSGAVNQLRDEYRLAFADQQAQLNAQAQAQPLGPQSPFLPSGEKAVYAMTPEEVAARQAGRNRLMDDSMIGSLANLVGDLVLGKNRGVSSSSPLSTNLPPTFTPPSEGANPISDSIGRLFGFTKDREPISLVELGLESPQQAALREQFNPTQTLITPTFNSGVQAEPSTQPSDTLQTGQVTPTIQSITGVEQAQEQAQGQAQGQAPQPQATFTLPSGEVRSIEPGQGVASAFGRESGRPMTFQVDGGEVTIPSVESIAQTMNLGEQAARQAQQDMAMQTMNLGEQAAARQAQQEFLASPAASEMSNRMLRSVMYNDPYAQASAERVARMEAKPDFNRAVSDRERRGTGEMSRSEATRIAESQGYEGQQARDVADGYITLQRQGRDPMTGKEVEAPFEPKEIEIGGQKYIQLAPNYFQPIKEDTPKKTGLQSSLDDLQADFQSGRLTKEQFDLAVENITNTYIGRNKEKPRGGVVSEVEKIIAAGEGDSVDSTFTPQQEAGIEAVMNANKITREAAIQALKDAGKLN